MEKLKRFAAIAPEYILLTSVLFYWLSSSITNPIAIVLFIVVVLQLIFKNKMIGFFVGLGLLVVTIYMFMALFSELNEFPEFTTSARNLLVFGSLYLGITLFASISMIVKNTRTLS